MPKVIEASNIHRIYQTKAGATQALRGVSFSVEKGEFLAIMGPSGSGKSTLMNIIGCLDKPTFGNYHLEGQDVAEYSDDALADLRATRIGFVFQSFNLLPRATLLRNVMLPLIYTLCPRREREARARTALRAVGLEERFFDHRSNEISGGQMQRVAIARALVNNPALILADEPTGNLDTATGEMVLDTFAALRQQGRTIVLITHESDVAAHADRILYIRDGLIYSHPYLKNPPPPDPAARLGGSRPGIQAAPLGFYAPPPDPAMRVGLSADTGADSAGVDSAVADSVGRAG